MPFLTAKSLHLHYRHSIYSKGRKSFFYILQLKRSDNRFYFSHL